MSDTPTTPPEPDTSDWRLLTGALAKAETVEADASARLVAARQACEDAATEAAAAATDYAEATTAKLDLAEALESYRSNWERINAL